MSLFDPKDTSKKAHMNITMLFFIVILLLFIIVVLINLMLGTISWESFTMDFINSLIGVMIPLLLFNIFFDRMTSNHYNLELSEKITEGMLLNKKVLDRFTKETKKQFLKSITESILGKNEGEMLYTTLMSPYLDNKYNFRKNYRYNIVYKDNFELKSAIGNHVINFDPKDYYLVQEEFAFQRSMNNYNLKQRKVSAGFSYGLKDLNPLFKGEGVFFRENFLVSEEHIAMLQQLSNEELEEFVKETLQFTFELDDNKLSYNVTNSVDGNGFYLNFEIDDRVELDPDKMYKFKYTFQMPQLKTENKFIAIVSEPTEYVDIFFTHTDRNVKLQAVPFFDDSEVLT